MPELPRLTQFTDIQPKELPGPEPGASSMVSRAAAQGFGNLETALGHITAKTATKEAELAKQEKLVTDRFNAENSAFAAFMEFTDKADQIQKGQLTYENFPKQFPDKTGPIRTEDLMPAYRAQAQKIREDRLKELAPQGTMAGYLFTNEFDGHLLPHFEKLHAERDKRMIGDIQGQFQVRVDDIVAEAGRTGNLELARRKYEDAFRSAQIALGPEQQTQRRKDDASRIRMSTADYMIGSGFALKVIKGLESNDPQFAHLTPDERQKVYDKALEVNYKRTQMDAAKDAQDRRNFEHASGDFTKKALGQMSTPGQGLAFTRTNLEQMASRLTKDDYKFLEAGIHANELQGGPGNPPKHMDAKYNISLHPDGWSTERIKSYSAEHGLNSFESLDLVNELYKADNQRRTAANDPNHFSKNPQYKQAESGIRKLLGISPLAVLKPPDENMAQQAENQFYNIFQRAYDEGRPLPNIEQELNKIVKLYRPKFSWVTDDTIYGTVKELEQAYKNKEITIDKFANDAYILLQRERALRMESQGIKE